MATKLYSPFFFFFCSAHRRASERHYSARRNVRSGLIELTIRQWHAEKREAPWCRGAAKRQAGLSHAYGAFHYIKPFQCIIYFCVSHLRYGLCTGDGGQRVLSLQHRRPKDSSPSESIARARARVWYTLSSRTIFHGSFASLTPLLRQAPFCIAPAVAARHAPHAFCRRKKALVHIRRCEIVRALENKEIDL